MVLTKRRSHGASNVQCDDNSMIEKTCTKEPRRKQASVSRPKLLENDSVALTKKRAPHCVHNRDDGLLSPMMEESSTKPIVMKLNDVAHPPLVRKKSLNSLFKEMSLKHQIPEDALDKPLMKKQDSMVLTKRRSPGCVHENREDLELCPKPTLMEHDSLALTKKRTPNCIHSK